MTNGLVPFCLIIRNPAYGWVYREPYQRLDKKGLSELHFKCVTELAKLSGVKYFSVNQASIFQRWIILIPNPAMTLMGPREF